MARSALFMQSVEKAFRVLEVFGESDRYLGLSEIVGLSGLDKSSAQRCTHTLVQTGYLDKHPKSGRFSLATRCLDLSFHFLRTHPLVLVGTPLLLELRRVCGERTNLSLFDDLNLVYAIRLPGRRGYPQYSNLIGRRMPTFCSAGGRAVLAKLPDEEMRDIIARSPRRAMTPDTKTDPAAIEAEVMKARQRGYGFVVNESAPNELTVAAAITDASARPVGAVHIAGSISKWLPEDYESRFAPLVQEAARALSHAGSQDFAKAGGQA